MNTTLIKSTQSIAIIGAGGFLGKHLTKSLSSQIYDLRCFDHNLIGIDKTEGIQWIEGDISSSSLIEAINGCSTVIHLASTSTPSTADKNISEDAKKNIQSSLHLFDQCAASGVKRIIFISSGGTVYGSPDIIPTPESAPTYPITAYGVTKLTIEKYLDIYLRQKDIDYRVLRVSNIYGPLQTAQNGQGVIASFLSKIINNQPIEIWGDGSITRDYIFVDDVIDAIISCIEDDGAHKIFNIGRGKGTSLNKIIQLIETTIGVKVQKKLKPGRKVDVKTNILDCSLANEQLKWHPQTSLADGLKETYTWIKNICRYTNIRRS